MWPTVHPGSVNSKLAASVSVTPDDGQLLHTAQGQLHLLTMTVAHVAGHQIHNALGMDDDHWTAHCRHECVSLPVPHAGTVKDGPPAPAQSDTRHVLWREDREWSKTASSEASSGTQCSVDRGSSLPSADFAPSFASLNITSSKRSIDAGY